MALLLYTACRREDVVRFGPRQFRSGRVQFRQAKNEDGENPVDIDIPLHPDLAAIIAATPSSGATTFLTTEFGSRFRLMASETSSGAGVIRLDYRNVPPMGLGRQLLLGLQKRRRQPMR
jgi:hypothetical protein